MKESGYAMQTVKLASRNLSRNRRRTLSTLCAIVIGMVGILLFGGYNQSIKYSLQTSFVRDTGHLQIQRKDYMQYGTSNPAQYSISDYRHIMSLINRDPVLKPMLAASTPVLVMTGIAGHYSAGTSRPVLIYGSETEGQTLLSQWDEYALGDLLETRRTLNAGISDAALIGSGLAHQLQLCRLLPEACKSPTMIKPGHNSTTMPADLAELSAVSQKAHGPDTGSHIELLAVSTGGAPNIVRVNVTGIQPQPARELDNSFVGIHLKQAQQLLFGYEKPGVTAIILQLHQTSQLETARARLQHLFDTTLKAQDLTVYDFSELQPLYLQILMMFKNIFDFLLVLILCLALFTVGNTMSMAVIERTVEIGTLRAMGLKQRDIQWLFLCEGIWLGVIGSLLGVVMAVISAFLINHSGLTWQPPGVIAPVPIQIRVWGEWLMITRVVGILLAATVFSSWWPARRASKVYIATALRHI